MALRSHKIALDTTQDQRSWFAQQCGYARFAYNYALSDFKDTPQHWKELNKRFNVAKHGIEWTGDMDQRAAVFGIKHLGDAISRWRKGQNSFPKYKKRSLGWVRMFEELRFAGEIIKVTISRHAHRWFVSITVDTGTPNVPRDTRGLPVISVDVGINTLATLDDGTAYANPCPLRRYERKLKREQRKLSRKEFLSSNYFKQKRHVERLHYWIACIREDAQQKATTEIVNRGSAIGIETLKVTNLLKNRNIAKALSDSALGSFLALLKSKAETLGIPIVQASRFFASSKTCSACGKKKEDLTLSDREYICDSCGYRQDRDINAAINLKHLAVGQTESLNACGV